MHFFRGSCGGPHKASFSRIDYGYLQRVRERRGEEMQRATGEMGILVRSFSQQVHFRISSLVRGVCSTVAEERRQERGERREERGERRERRERRERGEGGEREERSPPSFWVPKTW